jgi:PAS domain S-box-containing protein
MKILYVGFDRGDAALVAHALHASAQNLSVTWAQTPASALEWLQTHPDAAAVIVQVQAQSCVAFVEQLRGASPGTAVVMVAGAPHIDAALAILNAGADGYLAAGASLDTELPRVLTMAVERAWARGELHRAVAAAETRLAELRVQHAAARACDARLALGLQERLLELERTLQTADERRVSEVAALADQLARRHAEFTATLAQTAQARDALAARLSAATAALDDAQRAREADGAAAAERLRRREAELAAAVAESTAARATLQAALANLEADYRDAQVRADADRAAAYERQSALEDLLAEETDALRHLQQKLGAEEGARRQAEDRHSAELADVTAQLAGLRASHEAALREHASTRAALEQDAHDARAESGRTRRRLLYALSYHRRRHLDRAVRHDAQIAAERADAAERQRVMLEDARQLQLEGETMRRLLTSTQERAQHLQSTLDDERQAHAAVRVATESELHRLASEYSQLQRSFDGLQSAFQTLEETAGAHVTERARLESLLADRDRELHAQVERHRMVEQDSHAVIAELRDRLDEERETHRSETARHEREALALRTELDASRGRAEALRRDADRVPDLQADLELSRRERRRDFERAPYALCRCSQDGVIVDANHAFVSILGRRRVDELCNTAFTAAVFHCAGDLSWLLERTRTVRRTETVETEWVPGDGRHLVVRLHALAASTGTIEIVVEDITEARALEERLRRAQRMEAVGRLASEVATTCEGLLRDVIRDANDYVASIGDDAGLRHQGEQLVTDASQAATLLRQLTAYADSQARGLEPVSAQRILQDLAPVLQRVVGDRIELALSKSSGAFAVDVAAERLERILINVAGYARQRMPDGGQMRIDLATTAVGRRFVARHPNVRPGDHVLITVTELPQAGESMDVERGPQPFDNVGVDLGALVELIGTCGGHLWMEAQPAGNMVVKIHLPKRATAADARAERGGRLARWFRAASATAGLRA